MGGAASTAGTTVAVPLLREVYGKTRFILVNLTNLGPYVIMAKRFFSIGL